MPLIVWVSQLLRWPGPYQLFLVELTQKDAELRGLRTEVGILRISQKYYRRESATRLCIIIALAVALLILLIFFLFF